MYQQLQLEHLNLGRWWDGYVCFMVLHIVQEVLLNTFNKNSIVYLQFCFPKKIPSGNHIKHISCWTKFLKMLVTSALLMNGINMNLPSEVLVLKVYFVMFHWILLGLPKENLIVLMSASVVYQINPNTELQRNEKNIIWSFKNFRDLKLILKYL